MKFSSRTSFLIIIAVSLVCFRLFIYNAPSVSEQKRMIQEAQQLRSEIQEGKRLNNDISNLEKQQFELYRKFLLLVQRNKTSQKDIINWFGEPDLIADCSSDLTHIDGWSIYIKLAFDPLPDGNQTIYGYKINFSETTSEIEITDFYGHIFFICNNKSHRVTNYYHDLKKSNRFVCSFPEGGYKTDRVDNISIK